MTLVLLIMGFLFAVGLFLLLWGIIMSLLTLLFKGWIIERIVKKGLPQGTNTAEQVWKRGLKRLGMVTGAGLAMLLIGTTIAAINVLQKPSPPPASGTITTGQQVDLVQKSISPVGGNISVDKPGDPLNGFQMEIRAESYRDTRSFHISYAPVKKHTFGKSFNPVSPLISIENGGGYSNEIIRLKIPVKVPEKDFAMAFFYNDQTGTLEGLPLLSRDTGSLTVATKHFSKIIVSSIARDTLFKLTGEVNSGFKPGVDDWQFTNYGSYIAQGGHCAGQSMTTIWYYAEKALKGAPHLFGLYDNNGNGQTPSLWQDDTLGYRFASTIQNDMDWHNYHLKLQSIFKTGDEPTYNAFAYAMLITGLPQLVVITNTSTIPWEGHAMVIYRVSKGALHVSDPNFPANSNREIKYNNGKFIPYPSGANASVIQQGQGKSYDLISYYGITALIDWNKLASRWGELQAGTIGSTGNTPFPDYTLKLTEGAGSTHNLKDGLTVYNKKAAIDVNGQKTLSVGLYRDGAWVSNGAGKINLSSKTDIDLRPGKNLLGIGVYGFIPGSHSGTWEWVDFKWVNIFYSPPTSVEMDPAQATIRLGSKHLFRATARDSSGKVIENLPASAFIWSSANQQVATVDKNGSASGLFTGETTISAAIGDAIGTAKLSVSPLAVASIQLDPPSATILVGKSQTFRVIAKDANGTVLEGLAASIFGWATANTAIATVDRNGIVTGQVAGTTAVAAAFRDTAGSAISGSAIVRVTSEQTPSPPPLAGGPDLTVTSVSFSPSSGKAGQNLSVTFTIKNQGGAATGPFSNRISLATTRYGTNYSLGNFAMESLPAGASRTLTLVSNAIPTSVPNGSYWVTVFTDGFQQVNEFEENNNIGSQETVRFALALATPPPTSTPRPVSGTWKGQAILTTNVTGAACRFGGDITLSLTQTGETLRGTITYDLGGDPNNSSVRCPATRIYGTAPLTGTIKGSRDGGSVRFSFTTTPPFAGFTINASGLAFMGAFIEGDFTGDAQGEFHVKPQ